jgi:Asp-tRNA(Asn)/Glu-tRNA(Gln) amidotransferase A subunit family amidase
MLQLIGRRMDETTLLRVGASLESMIGFDALIPKYVREGKWPKV